MLLNDLDQDMPGEASINVVEMEDSSGFHED